MVCVVLAKRKEAPPEEPALLARRDRRQAALAAWFRLKVACPNWGAAFEVVDGIAMRMRITTAAGDEVKVWRPDGRDVFQLAANGKLEPGVVEPERLTAAVLAVVLR
jgi:hypothetical protein